MLRTGSARGFATMLQIRPPVRNNHASQAAANAGWLNFLVPHRPGCNRSMTDDHKKLGGLFVDIFADCIFRDQ